MVAEVTALVQQRFKAVDLCGATCAKHPRSGPKLLKMERIEKMFEKGWVRSSDETILTGTDPRFYGRRGYRERDPRGPDPYPPQKLTLFIEFP